MDASDREKFFCDSVSRRKTKKNLKGSQDQYELENTCQFSLLWGIYHVTSTLN